MYKTTHADFGHIRVLARMQIYTHSFIIRPTNIQNTIFK